MLRFAKSPDSDINVEDLRIAIFNFILSKQREEELLIRIDDTNKDKNIEGKDKEILEILNLFSIEHSRVVFESENIKYHTGMGMKLLLDKKAFNCFCSDEVLEEDKQKAKKEGKPYSYSGFCLTISDETKFQCNAPFVVRLKKPEKNIEFTELLKGECNYTPDEVDSIVILAHDKSPTSHFASAVDDMLCDTSLILTTQKNILDIPKQIHIRESLGYDKKLEYILIPNMSEENLLSVQHLIDEGFLPSAIANYIMTLGFNTPKEIFTLEEAIEWFDIKKLSLETVEFSLEKLKVINKEHLKAIDNMRLSKLLGFADEDIGVLGKIYLEEFSTLKEVKEKVEKIFSKRDDSIKQYDEIKSIVKGLPYIDKFENFKSEVMKKSGLSESELEKPLSYILTGSTQKVELDKIYTCIKNYLGEIV